LVFVFDLARSKTKAKAKTKDSPTKNGVFMSNQNVPCPSKKIRRLLSLKPGDFCKALLLGDWLAREVHFDRSTMTSDICTGDGCEICHLPKSWRAYIPALVQMWTIPCPLGSKDSTPIDEPQELVIELRAGQGVQLDGLELRGMVVELLKPKGAKTQPLRLFITNEPPRCEIPPSFDVEPTLCLIWNNPKAFDQQPATDKTPKTLPFPKTA
jgi:hypothetical protein